MKLSFMTFACPRWTFDQVLAAAVQHGYHGIEFRCDAQHRHGVEPGSGREERRRFLAALQSAAVEPCCLATSLQFSQPESVAAAGPRIELAVDLGVPALRVLCGSPREELSRPALIGRCAEHLREAADLAAQAGVQLWLETHDRASRAADCAAIVRAADHPALGISYDNMHPYRAGEPLEATLAALGSLVGHCHFHDGLADPAHVVIRPLGLGEMPVDDMFHGLLDLGYDGYLSGEWFDDMYGAEPDQALAAYHRDMVGLLRRHGAKLG